MLPDWVPDLPQVAAYVPHRTLVRDTSSTVGSDDEYLWTWDPTTTPPDTTVNRLVADGTAWISARVTPMHPTSQAAAGVLVALYAAAAVERGWPHDDQSLPRANDMEKRLDRMLADLVRANDDANSQDGTVYPPAVQPVWSFPPADARYDDTRYW